MLQRLRWMPRARWKRWLLVLALIGVSVFLGLVTLVFTAVMLWRNPKTQAWVMLTAMRHDSHQPGQVPPFPRLSTQERSILLSQTAQVEGPDDVFRATNVWDVQLKFTSNQWVELGPKSVAPVLPFLKPDGSVILRNPNASRNGLAGVFGLDFPWSAADLTFGDSYISNVGARFKGNGTFVNSQKTYKRPFKVQLNKNHKEKRLGGVKILNLHNLTSDSSCVSDALAYEFFREAGVPAPRTAFARVRLSIQGRFDDRLLGLYVMVENPDAEWSRTQFGVEGIALFKPVTYELFADMGEDWKTYEPIYDPKTKVTTEDTSRLIALAKLTSHAFDAEFARQIDQFVDVDEFARFLACEVILSNYDGFLSNGQNFLVYLDPHTRRFGFVPWDLDQCWGEFGFVGTMRQREQASLWHPWVGQNRFLERMLKVPAVRTAYRRELERIRNDFFVPERLSGRLATITQLVRPFIAEESGQRLSRFEREVAAEGHNSPEHAPANAGARGFNLNHFFVARAASVSAQLEGKSEGAVLAWSSRR